MTLHDAMAAYGAIVGGVTALAVLFSLRRALRDLTTTRRPY